MVIRAHQFDSSFSPIQFGHGRVRCPVRARSPLPAGAPGAGRVPPLSWRFERVAGRTGGLSGVEKRSSPPRVELSRRGRTTLKRVWVELGRW